MRKAFLYLLAALFVLNFISCNLDDGDDSPSKVALKSLAFNNESEKIVVGESKTVYLSYSPSDADDVKIEYSLSGEGIVSLSGDTDKGCVVTGVSAGSVILIAQCQGITSYCEIDVIDDGVKIDPYIVVPFVSMEVKRGARKAVIASLYGGSASDNQHFKWSSSSSCVNIESSGNTCVIEGVSSGSSRITVHNDKSVYDASFMVYVPEAEAQVFYLTTGSNVLKAYKGQSVDFEVECVGGNSSDVLYLASSVVEGSGNVTVTGNSGLFSVTGKEVGQSLIEVSHPKADEKLSVRVIVSQDKGWSYVEADRDVVVLAGDEEADILATVVGEAGSDAVQCFTCEVSDDSVVSVGQSGSYFHVRGLKDGKSIITIKNKYAEISKEVLVVVGQTQLVSTVSYITLSKPLLKMEKGGADIDVSVSLIGGTEADRNNFLYEVSDSTVIKVEPYSGSVSYRSALEQSPDIYNTGFTVVPVGVGTAEVVVSHPKSASGVTCTVRVYPSGTFVEKSEAKGVSFITVEKGTPYQGEVELFPVCDTSDFEWNISDSSVCSVRSSGTGFVLEAKSDGIVTLTLDSPLLSYPYRAVVLCGDSEYLRSQGCFYADGYGCEVEKDRFVYVPVRFSDNIDVKDSLPGEFSLSVTDSSVIYARMSGSTLIILGKAAGEADVILTNTAVTGYSLYYHVKVSDSSVSLDYPYEIKGTSFLGVVVGQDSSYEVELGNAPESAIPDIRWKVSSGDMNFSVKGNGNKCIVGAKEAGEGCLTVTHPMCSYEKKVFLYSALTEEALKGKVFMASEKYNYLCHEGDFLPLSVELSDSGRNEDVVWSCSDGSICEIDSEAERCFVSCKSSGNAVITASLEGSSPVNFYVSVIENTSSSGIEKQEIKFPSVVEVVTGGSSVVSLSSSEKDSSFGEDFEWVSLCDLVELKPSSSSCYVRAKKAGVGYIEVSSVKYDFTRRITVHVCDLPEEFSSSYVMNVPKNTYCVNEGKDVSVSVTFGTNSLPDIFDDKFVWESVSDCVELYPNGRSCMVSGVKEGVATVTVSNPHVLNAVTFDVVVLGDESGLYVFAADRILKVVVGEPVNAGFKVFSSSSSQEVARYDDVRVSSVSDEGAVGCTVIGNVLRLSAGKEGVYSVTLRSELYGCSHTYMVFAASSSLDLASMWCFSPQKDHYLLSVGEEKVISLVTEDNDEEHLRKITFSQGQGGIVDVEKVDEKNYRVRGLSQGTSVLVFTDGSQSHEVYVSVSSVSAGEADFKVEPVILLVKGSEYTSYFTGSVSSVTSSDESLAVSFEDGKNFFTVVSSEVGMKELLVSGGGSEKRIRCYTVSDKASLSSVDAWNIDLRNYELSVGGSVRVRPVVASSSYSESDVTYSLKEDYGIVTVSEKEGVLSVTGKAEGIACVTASFRGKESLDLYFTVTEGGKEKSSKKDDLVYLSCSQLDYFVNLDGSSYTYIDVSVEGGVIPEDGWVWKASDETLLKLTERDNFCSLLPKGKKGECYVTCSSPYASNVLTFRVVVGLNYEDKGKKVSYVCPSKNTVDLTYGGSSVVVGVTLENMEGESVSDIVVGEGSVYASVSSYVSENVLYLTFIPRLCGSARLSLHHPKAEFDSYIDYFVSDSADGTVPYLTTSDNYVFVRPGEYKAVSVRLRNYEGLDEAGYKWESSGDNFIVLGEGSEVQVFGVREGDGYINVSHKDSKVMNSLRILVRVQEGKVSSKYITTSSNVIETKVSQVMDSFMVSLVGDSAASSSFKYTSSDSTVLSVVGNNDTCYFRGLKAGTAQVTVSNDSEQGIPDIYVMVIVSEAESDGVYLSSETPVMYMMPFGNPKSVAVEVNNVKKVDEAKFVWSLYSQAPSSSSGGEVIELSESGSRAVITPKNEGIAKVRVLYAPNNVWMNFIVYVSSVGQVSFVSSEVTVDEGDMTFEEIEVPDFTSDMEGFITYTVDDPSVCRVSGTSDVCCISGLKAGTTIVHVNNSYDSSSDDLVVTVASKGEDDTPHIFVNKSCFVLNPRSVPETIDAVLQGAGVTEDDYEDFEWSVSGNKSVSIYPKKGPEVTLSLVEASDGKGRTDILEGSAIITVTNPKCAKGYKKTLFVTVEEVDGFFSLDNVSLDIDTSMTKTVTAKLIGGRVSDYENVIWSIEGAVRQADGTTKEVARVLNESGQRCSILAINEGKCYLTAFYKGNVCQCVINVKGDRYFSIVNNVLTLYPGQNYPLKYELRPKTSVPTFFSSDSSQDKAVISYTVDTVGQNVNIKALNAGTCTLTGMVAGIGTVTVNVSVTYNPFLKDLSKQSQIPINMYDEGTASYNKTRNTSSAKFKCYPPIYYVQCTHNIPEDIAAVSMTMTHESDDEATSGVGELTVQAFKEFPQDNNYAITLTQYEDADFKKRAAQKSLVYYPSARYVDSNGKREAGYKIYFKKNLGDFTCPVDSSDSYYKKSDDGKDMLLLVDGTNKSSRVKVNEGTKYTIQFDDTRRMPWGDGESHMIVFEPVHKGQSFKDLKVEFTGNAGGGHLLTGEKYELGFYPKPFEEKKGLYTCVIKTGNDIGFDCDLTSDETGLCWPEKSNEHFYPRFAFREAQVYIPEDFYVYAWDTDYLRLAGWYPFNPWNYFYWLAGTDICQSSSGTSDEMLLMINRAGIPIAFAGNDADIATVYPDGDFYKPRWTDGSTWGWWNCYVSEKKYLPKEAGNPNGKYPSDQNGYYYYQSVSRNIKIYFYGRKDVFDNTHPKNGGCSLFEKILWTDTNTYASTKSEGFFLGEDDIDYIWYGCAAFSDVFPPNRGNPNRSKITSVNNDGRFGGSVFFYRELKNPKIRHADNWTKDYTEDDLRVEHVNVDVGNASPEVGGNSYYKHKKWIESGFASCWPNNSQNIRKTINADLRISFTDEFSGESQQYVLPVQLQIRDCYALIKTVGDIRNEDKASELKKLY